MHRKRIFKNNQRDAILHNLSTRWFKYDRDLCGLFTHKSVPVIFEPPCISVKCSACFRRFLHPSSGAQKLYTGCNRRNGPDFGRVFLRSNYTYITQNTYTQSWKVTEILAREKSGLLWCLRTVLVSVTLFSPLLEMHSYVRANVAPVTLTTEGAFSSV